MDPNVDTVRSMSELLKRSSEDEGEEIDDENTLPQVKVIPPSNGAPYQGPNSPRSSVGSPKITRKTRFRVTSVTQQDSFSGGDIMHDGELSLRSISTVEVSKVSLLRCGASQRQYLLVK